MARFGELLTAWPDIVAGADRLKNDGVRSGEKDCLSW
jgi:hypothetical protein